MRHFGMLTSEYDSRLEEMSLQEIAIEAAKFRSDGKLPGTATALILRKVRHKYSVDTYHKFLRVYSACWAAEQVARREALSARPANRPAKGGRSRQRASHRRGMSHVLA